MFVLKKMQEIMFHQACDCRDFTFYVLLVTARNTSPIFKLKSTGGTDVDCGEDFYSENFKKHGKGFIIVFVINQ